MTEDALSGHRHLQTGRDPIPTPLTLTAHSNGEDR